MARSGRASTKSGMQRSPRNASYTEPYSREILSECRSVQLNPIGFSFFTAPGCPRRAVRISSWTGRHPLTPPCCRRWEWPGTKALARVICCCPRTATSAPSCASWCTTRFANPWGRAAARRLRRPRSSPAREGTKGCRWFETACRLASHTELWFTEVTENVRLAHWAIKLINPGSDTNLGGNSGKRHNYSLQLQGRQYVSECIQFVT